MDAVVMWGTNARNAHPIFFHHVIKGIDNGARSWTIDPRRTSTAKFTDSWLGLNVGTDIGLAHGVARGVPTRRGAGAAPP